MRNLMIDYQADGEAETITEANGGIILARSRTPEAIRHLYTSHIGYIHRIRKYYWEWVLR